VKRTKKKISPEDISAKARAGILKKLNNAKGSIDNPLLSRFEDKGGFVFPEPEDLLKTFVSELEEINGIAIAAENNNEAEKQLLALLNEKDINEVFCTDETLLKNLTLTFTNDPDKFRDMEAGITKCEALIARSGSVMVSSEGSGRRMNVFPPVHIVWAYREQLVPFIADAFTMLKKKYGSRFPSQVSIVTGPSRTADIEKTLVMGAHGPRELIVVIVDHKD
jgi:L-lactate dehydrogenase complex protein LldG